MSSDLVSSMEALQMNDYASLILITAVVYDYSLTLSREIEYVWRKPWTIVSTIFVLVRYVGLTWTITNGLFGSSFVPGPQKVFVSASIYCPHDINAKQGYPEGSVLVVILTWGYLIFLTAADWVMILRVYSMWNRSKRIICILLCIYIPQIITSYVLVGIYDNPSTHLSVTVAHTLDVSCCNYSSKDVPSLLKLYIDLPRFILGTTLLILAIAQTLKQSVEMYRATKRWQPNRYMRLLVRDGMLYFLVYASFNVIAMLQDGTALNSTALLFLILLSNIAICIALPRFIIDMRELYDHVLSGRWQHGIDTGFGVLSQPADPIELAALSAIAFMDVTPGQSQTTEGAADADESEGIRLETLKDHMHQV